MPRPHDPYETLARAILGHPRPERRDEGAPRAMRGPTPVSVRRHRTAVIRLVGGGESNRGRVPNPDGPRPVLVLVK